ncbi:MAG: AI-2E family transporter [Rickettsiales bacterium]|nr:AI-2E family transporter [Rickettsiales bacterium]
MAKAKTTPESLLSRRLLFWLLITLLFFGFLFLIRDMLLPFILGILIAYCLDPAADKLEKWGCSRGISTSIITVLFFAALTIIILALAPTLAKQVSGLLADIPSYISILQGSLIEQVGKLPIPIDWEHELDTKALVENIISDGKGLAARLVQSGMALINMVSLLVITPVVSFYLLRDWDKLVKQLDTLLPRNHADIIRTQLQKVDETLAGFIRGQFNVMLILGIFYAGALLFAELKYAVIIGLLCGFLIIIPYIGTLIGGILSTGIAFMQFDDWHSVAIVAGIFVIGQVLEGYALTPKLVGDRVGLHPVWIIFGMLAGASLFGFVGILIAVPVTAIIGVLVRFAIEEYQDSHFYKGN